jgi:hypothetical protein
MLSTPNPDKLKCQIYLAWIIEKTFLSGNLVYIFILLQILYHGNKQLQFVGCISFFNGANIQLNICLRYLRTYALLHQRKYLFELNLVFDCQSSKSEPDKLKWQIYFLQAMKKTFCIRKFIHLVYIFILPHFFIWMAMTIDIY